MTKHEMKCRISMALKDPILQQGFEIICKENAELKSIADFQTSSNMDRHFQLKRSKEQLAKAKLALRNVIDYLGQFCSDYPDCVIEAEEILKKD